MKKIAALILALLLALSMATVASAEALTADDIKVGLVMPGSLGDESINDQAYHGLQMVEEAFGVKTKYVECMDSAQYFDAIETLCDSGFNVIVCDSYEFEDALKEICGLYPDTYFMILDTYVPDIPNLASFMYATHECSYLAGIVAAMKSESNVVGFIGGMQIPTIEKFQVGFEEGVAAVNPDATVLVKYIGNDNSAWTDPATAKSLTLECIANGADVCYHAAGASGLGMIEACHENDIWAIGVNIDENHCDPCHVLTSALTLGDQAIYLYVESILNGAPLTDLTILNCENGGVGVVESEYLGEDVIAAVNEASAKIVSGEVTVTNVMEN